MKQPIQAEDSQLASDAQAVRRKYLYRKLIVNERAKIPVRLAMKLVGPDCAYHLYRGHKPK